MNIKARVKKVEKAAMPKRVACFILYPDKPISGRAWWSEEKWENMGMQEYEVLKAQLETSGVEVIQIIIEWA